MLLIHAGMRTNLLVMVLSAFVIVGLLLSATKGFTAPIPLERAMELVKSNHPEEPLEALSIYHPSREAFSDYHDAYAQAPVHLNKLYDFIEHYRLTYPYAERGAK